MRDELGVEPSPQIVGLALCQFLTCIGVIGSLIALFCGKVLPHGHGADLLRGEAHGCAIAIYASKTNLTVRKGV